MRLLLLLYPWLELLSLIQLGVETSPLTAIAWVIGMILIGSSMLRHVGTASVMRLREAQQSGILQQHLFVDDMAVAVAALLLIIPGLVSDFFALVVLIGPMRRGLARLLLGKVTKDGTFSAHSSVHRYDPHRSAGHKDSADAVTIDAVTIEGSFERVDEACDGALPDNQAKDGSLNDDLHGNLDDHLDDNQPSDRR